MRKDIIAMDILHLHSIDLAFNWLDFSHHSITILAQTFDDIDIIGDMEEAWHNFVETGQCWALLIGVIVGYGFKGMTNY